MYSPSVEFTLMRYSFDIALDLCSEVDIQNFSASNHVVHSRWVLLKLTVYFYCILFLLHFICLVCLYRLWRVNFIIKSTNVKQPVYM